ncbi:conserved hypothetical protein [Mesorhizobium delmotii]|uniref:Uncharacterized protein n=1 Tax=Mesorhizobium delmotii TaxID=1631247 RepID=A0A2P9ATM4_9HYPH|nr:conserved hypothetical protein [Mesorhizobium delmotii]
MRLATLHLETARYGDVYRAARLGRLRQQMIRHIKRTDASAQKVEQALASLAEATSTHGPARAASVGPRLCALTPDDVRNEAAAKEEGLLRYST